MTTKRSKSPPLTTREDLKILFCNKLVRRHLSGKANLVTDVVLAELKMEELSLQAFQAAVSTAFDSPMGEPETIAAGEHGRIWLAKFFVLTDDGSSKAVLVVSMPHGS